MTTFTGLIPVVVVLSCMYDLLSPGIFRISSSFVLSLENNLRIFQDERDTMLVPHLAPVMTRFQFRGIRDKVAHQVADRRYHISRSLSLVLSNIALFGLWSG